MEGKECVLVERKSVCKKLERKSDRTILLSRRKSTERSLKLLLCVKSFMHDNLGGGKKGN